MYDICDLARENIMPRLMSLMIGKHWVTDLISFLALCHEYATKTDTDCSYKLC